ncbi:MAG: SAM-dependent methyltransferase [Anaeroplasma sp.]|uniref:class I SAM-dependent methyltransferase n=1 Tax=Anaeroplasma sp. TaxID=1872523 RepID=UPI002A914C71|nr:SAM-dependent methyltransferase [Anaeroplasma sp.]MDY5982630.1 SAM-dependent methyltransferase [Anaeroplasma sp.]
MLEITLPEKIIKGVISGKKDKNQKNEKVKIDTILIKDKPILQFATYTDKQVFHKNVEESEAKALIISFLNDEFNNLELTTEEYIYSYRVTQKGKVLSNKRKAKEVSLVPISHNKKKNYILEDGTLVPALVDLDIQMPDGKVTKAGYDKFKQINRFLEIIDDCIKEEKHLNIIDFGCGKSYLTFILYYYFVKIKKMDVNITGLDLKEDVIDHCNEIADKYGYSKLKFYKGDIAKYKEKNDIDMIVTLHACDTATDYALYHAITMNVKYIFSVPCCQHEINLELDSKNLHIINKFGILKDRFSALLTDAIRANILQYYGYKTNVMEFVDFENSPKNLLIRAVKTNNSLNPKIKEEIDSILLEYNISQKLYSLLFTKEEQ